MLTAHFIRILVETVRWQRRSNFKTANVHNALGNFRGYVGLVDGTVERDPCWRVTIPVVPSQFSVSPLLNPLRLIISLHHILCTEVQ